MILAIDIGNTSTMVGIFSGGKLLSHFRIRSKGSGDSDGTVSLNGVGIQLRQLVQFHAGTDEPVDMVALCSVVPDLTPLFREATAKYFKSPVWELDYTASLGMRILYDEPRQVGADRLANALAAKTLFGSPAVVVDLGTATTFDVINADGDYAGGVIAPGVMTSAAELFRRASQLFPVQIEPPERCIGKTTADSMKSGIFYGALGLIDYLVEKIISEMGDEDIKIVATGGHAEKFKPYSKYLKTVDPTLTLQGILLAYEMNK